MCWADPVCLCRSLSKHTDASHPLYPSLVHQARPIHSRLYHKTKTHIAATTNTHTYTRSLALSLSRSLSLSLNHSHSRSLSLHSSPQRSRSRSFSLHSAPVHVQSPHECLHRPSYRHVCLYRPSSSLGYSILSLSLSLSLARSLCLSVCYRTASSMNYMVPFTPEKPNKVHEQSPPTPECATTLPPHTRHAPSNPPSAIHLAHLGGSLRLRLRLLDV